MMVIFTKRCGGGVSNSKELFNSYTMTWKILQKHWNDQTIKEHEDWWHTGNSTTADLLRRLMREWKGMRGQCSLIIDSTYCHPSFVYLHECLMFILNGSIKVGKSSCLSRNKESDITPSRSRLMVGGRVNLSSGGWGVGVLLSET